MEVFKVKIASHVMTQQAVSAFKAIVSEKIHVEVQSQNNVNDLMPSDRLSLSSSGLEHQKSIEGSPMKLSYSEEDLRKIELLEAFISQLLKRDFKFNFVDRQTEDERVNDKYMFKDTTVGQKTALETFSSMGRENITGMRITIQRQREEQEHMQFISRGMIRTSDGQEIQFDVNFNFSRAYLESEHVMIQIGEFHDPLVLNLDGKGIQFADHSITLDLNMDGHLDTFRALTEGSGLLVLDRNGNGIIDDGSEVIGAGERRAFEELMGYDEDKNLWIDEGDRIFQELKIWQVNSRGEHKLLGLTEAGVGALFLGSVESPFHFKDGFDAFARIHKSSVYLKSNGQVLASHEIDLKL
jgi:hypothetical protein